MALKSILVAASGGSASDGAVESACRLAKRFAARLEGFHVKTDPAQIIMMAADGFNMPSTGEWIDRLIADSATLAKTTETAFAQVTGRHALAPAASWREETGYAPVLVARRARFFDLCVLGRSDRVVERPHSDTIEETLIHSGRPVLIAPDKAPTTLGEHIVLGWNGSPEAVHALAGALPLMETAKSVAVLAVGDEADDGTLPLLDYLAAHGLTATHRRIAPVKGVGPGEQLLSEARSEGADLLAMGGYGHRPWRELLFGGATREVVGASLLPILIAH
ncbi:MAG TPA: universal stress protein [Stellaceae bacterium]|nr:universal stress protein [Stellaceae bacterium]